MLTGLPQKEQRVSVRAGRKGSPHLLWHVHALDAVAVDVVVERGVLGAVLGPLPLGHAAQHLLAFPLPCTTTESTQVPQKHQQSLTQHTRKQSHTAASAVGLLL